MTFAMGIVIVTLISTAICHWFAKRKHRNVSAWIMLGALFGPLAVVAAALVPSLTPSPAPAPGQRESSTTSD